MSLISDRKMLFILEQMFRFGLSLYLSLSHLPNVDSIAFRIDKISSNNSHPDPS